MNKIILIGRLTADPTLKYTPKGAALTRFTLAVDRRNKHTDFINITAFNKTAENCAEYLHKGSLTAIEGRLQIDNYTDQTGNKRTAHQVIADTVQFLGRSGEKETQQHDEWDSLGKEINPQIPDYEDEAPF